MKKTLILFLALLTTTSFAADAAKGKKLYQSCVQCHGEDGMGNVAEEAPKIAGQFDWYIASSIKAFKIGKDRKNPKMLPFIKNLSDSDIADLSAYISTMNQ